MLLETLEIPKFYFNTHSTIFIVKGGFVKLIENLRVPICIFFVFFQHLAFSQDPNELNIYTKKFTTRLPFDESFDIVIKNEELAKLDNVWLEISPSNKKQDEWYFKNKYISNSNITGVSSSDKKEIYFRNVRPLRANRAYTFSIKFEIKYDDISANLKSKVNQEIKDILIKGLDDYYIWEKQGKLKPPPLDTKKQLENYIQSILPHNTSTLFDTKIKVSPFSGPFKTFSNNYRDNHVAIDAAKTNRENALKVLVYHLKALSNEDYNQQVSNIAENSTKILLENFQKEDFDSEYVLKILSEIKNEFPIASDSSDDLNTTFLPAINQIIINNNMVNIEKEELEASLKNFTDFDLGELFQSGIFSIEGVAETDISADRNPYISYESGFGGRFDPIFNHYTNFVRFGALNITILPNSKAHLSNFNWRAMLLKSLSLQVGLAKPLTGDLDDRLENTAAARSIMLGAGVKLGFFRINYSGILYRVKDINPTINTSRIKWFSYPNVSLSISLKSISSLID